MKKFLLTILFLSGALLAKSQSPVINSVNKIEGTVDELVEISGANFGSSSASTSVFFGGSKGEIQNISNSFIEVRVPPGATTSSISVINSLNGLSGYSTDIFNINYGAKDPTLPLSFDYHEIPSGKELFDLCACDFDLDGKVDIAASKVSSDALDLQIYQNNSTSNSISFQQRNLGTNPELSVASPTLYIKCGDLNGDGKPDLITSRFGSTRNEVFVFRNTSTVGQIQFAFKKSIFLNGGDFAENLNIRDIDLDGKPEIVVTNTNNNFISIFKNTSTTTSINFEFQPDRVEVTGFNSTNALEIADLDNDGLPEIVVAPLFESNIAILKNTSAPGSFSFLEQIDITYDAILNQIKMGDLDRDGLIDIAIVNRDFNQIGVFRNTTTSSISFGSVQEFNTNNTSNSGWGISLGDITGNGNLDIIATSTASNGYTILRNTSSSGSISLSAESRTLNFRTRNIINADFSGDGKPDIAASAFNSTATSFRLIVDRLENCFNPQIIADTPSIDLCNGQDLRLEASRGRFVTYIWTKDAAVVQNSDQPTYEKLNIDNTDAGVYQVQAISEGGTCDHLSQTFTVNITAGDLPGIPTITNNSPVCEGEDVNFTVETLANIITYDWTGPDNFVSSQQNPTVSNITSQKSGKYSLVVRTATCSSDPIPSIVDVNVTPSVNIVADGPLTFCEGDSVILSMGTFSGYNYSWLKDATLIPGATTPDLTVKDPGSYSAVITQTTLNCTSQSSAVIVSTIQSPTSNFTFSGNLCDGSTINFTDNSAVDVAQNPQYIWDFGDGSSTVNAPNATHVYDSVGTYTVTLTVEYTGIDCSSSSQQNISINSSTTFDILVDGDNPFCPGASATLSTSLDFQTYLWSNGSTDSSIEVTAAGLYSVTVTNANGCESTSDIDISTFSPPTVEIIASKNPIQLGESVDLEASGASTYIWSPGESLNDSTIANPVATPTITTIYTALGTDINGCVGESSITIQVDEGSELPVTAPKLFSPNGDGVDDVWVIDNITNFPECSLVVFSRQGKNVYEAQPYNNNWDGTQGGNLLPEGPYFYVITCPDGKSTSGSISLIR